MQEKKPNEFLLALIMIQDAEMRTAERYVALKMGKLKMRKVMSVHANSVVQKQDLSLG